MATSRHARHDDAPVAFLVGAERSGTTLLRLMLDGHSELAFRYEFELAVDLVLDAGGWPSLDDYYEYLRTYRFVDPPPRIDRTLDYPALVRSFLEQKRVRDGKRRVGATVHRHFTRLLRIWPDARFVHLVRDPRDVARSCVAMGWAGHPWSAVYPWIEAEREWERVRRVVPPERTLEVRFEALVREPVAELTRICAFLGLGYDERMLEDPHRSSYRAPDASLAQRWRRTMSPRDVQRVEARLGDWLEARGYERSGLPAIEIGAVERAALRARCRAARARHAARTLGVRLWLERAVSQRVGPKAWREDVQLRIHDVVNAQLA